MASEAVEENTWAQSDGNNEIEGGNENIQLSDNTQDQDLNRSAPASAHAPAPAAPQTSGDSAPNTDGASEDVGEYDPESVSVTPLPHVGQQVSQAPAAQSTPQSTPQPANKKRKTAGGFLVGDSESEDDDSPAPAPASNGAVADPAPAPHSVPHPSPNASTPAQEAQGAVSNVPPTSQANTAPVASVEEPDKRAVAPAEPVNNGVKPPQDVVTTLEARIKEDPRGAMDAWLDLMAELRARNNIENIRSVYERFLAVFPQSADVWTAYMELELSMNNFGGAEELFKRTLPTIRNVRLWTVYLDYIRRRNDLSDTTGRARETIAQCFEFVLSSVGVDKDSGPIWAEYIQFIKSAPGQVGETDWASRQKMDQLRKTYQRAIAIPTRNLNTLWREYDQFELGIDKKVGRALLAQHSPNYMSAKSTNMALDNINRGLQRTNLPRLPPAPGFDGDDEYTEQIELWKKWISYEQSDPLDLKAEDPATWKKRVHYVYQQALMALRFWPDMWVDAAEWCFENEMVGPDGRDMGLEFLLQGIEANPESVLLALKHADRVEATHPIVEGDEAKANRGNAVKAPYNKVLDTLYDLVKKAKDQEKAVIDKINENHAMDSAPHGAAGDYEDAATSEEKDFKLAAKQAQIKAIEQGFSARTNVLSRTISFVWIALARAMRRVQGKGVVNSAIGGMRQVFTDARQRGRLTSDVYVAIALMEWKVYKDNAGVKIFERGARLFPEDEYFMVEYLQFLHSRDDFTNARVVFENCVKRMAEKPGSVEKAKALFAYFHKYESQYGDRSQFVKLEQRMAELFPEDPKLAHFKARFATANFDPIAARIIVSPSAQLRPKNIMPSIEQRASVLNSPRPSVRQPVSPRPQFVNSPKRPLPVEDLDDSLNPPRKMQRGESPLKGAAGRRLNQQNRMQAAPISRDITFLLSQIPPASAYDFPRFDSGNMVRFLREIPVPDFASWKNSQDRGTRDAGARIPPSHGRQVSADVTHYPFHGRNSPRPQSPFGASRGQIASAAATYRQSSLRPGSSGSGYEPPPPAAVYTQTAPPGAPAMGYGPPANMSVPDSSWPPPIYGAPPGQAQYTVPAPPFGQAPPQHDQYNGRYY
ncbi:hypothetical protein KVR01_012340 [Diaporthe batatas]|uniref:cleavage polyadenylation factor subunit RNA14 n=1 Tax=Diaporthe batatas TaxID=748121 RepID=UPI001D03CA5C|nr:cleavage polyadenylation factor subunit RNA14 [Diaporthe batatas]KAG8157678.1 hypothetical protein KVR01_012340 [Diaporthe batatas]